MPDFNKHPLNSKYDLDTALSGIWEFYKKWFMSLFSISFVFSLITSLLSGRINIQELYTITDPDEMLQMVGSMMGPYFIILILTFIFTLILQYYIIRKPVDTESNVFSIGITGLVKYFLPLLVLNIFLAVIGFIGILFGILLLFVGALFAIIYILMIASFMSPVLMIENKGIGDTITNTFRLAHSRFWQHIGWVAVFFILIMVIGFILGAVTMIPFGGSFIKTIINPENATDMLNVASRPSFIILTALANAVTMPLAPIFGLVLYFNAKSREGETVLSGNGDNGGKVTVEDLYSKNNSDSKKEISSNSKTRPPRVEDLTP